MEKMREFQKPPHISETFRETYLPGPINQARQEMSDAFIETQLPEDMRNFARNHKLENFIQMVWHAAFLAGWKARIEVTEND